MKKLLTIKEVHALIPHRCDGFNPSLRTVENMRRRNRRYLRSKRIGGRVFYKVATVEKFCDAINSGKVK